MFWRWLAVFTVNIFLMSWYWSHPVRIAVAFFVEIVLVLIFNRRKKDWVWVGVMAILGPMVDLIVVPNGGWSYPVPFVAGIPLWLPLGYVTSGLLMRRIIDDFPTFKKR